MPIYKYLVEAEDVLDYKIELVLDKSILENHLLKDLKGNKLIKINLLQGQTKRHGPRYKLYIGGDMITYATLRPNGKIDISHCHGNKTDINKYMPVAKAIIMATYDGALESFDNGNQKLIEKEVEEYNALGTEKKKNLVKRYNREIL